MQAIAEQTEAELSARLAEIEARINGGEGDLVALLEEREHVKREIQASEIIRQKRVDTEYRDKINKARERYIAEVQAEVAELWEVMPRLRWILAGLAILEERPNVSGFDGRNWDVITGLPNGAVSRICAVIAQELRGTTLQDEVGPLGTTSEPKIRAPRIEAVHVKDAGGTDLYGVPLHRPRTYYGDTGR